MVNAHINRALQSYDAARDDARQDDAYASKATEKQVTDCYIGGKVLRKADSASEVTSPALTIARPGVKARMTLTPVDKLRISEWERLQEQIDEQHLFIYSERGRDKACQDCVAQDVDTPWTELDAVAIRAVKCERWRIEAYCKELVTLCEHTLTQSKKTLATGPREIQTASKNARRALTRCRDTLHGELSIIEALTEQAQATLHVLLRARQNNSARVDIKHAFSRPPRCVTLVGCARQQSALNTYTFYIRNLVDIRSRQLLPAHTAVLEAIRGIDEIMPMRRP